MTREQGNTNNKRRNRNDLLETPTNSQPGCQTNGERITTAGRRKQTQFSTGSILPKTQSQETPAG
jgi:hypothetical protein